MNKQFDKLAAYAVVNGGLQESGIADVELPDIDYMAEKISGAGIAGELETLTLGHTQSMVTKIKWRTVTKDSINLYAPAAHNLVFLGAQQIIDAGTGDIDIQQVRISVRVMPKKLSLGKMDVNTKTDTANDFETLYLKVEIDGTKMIEIDKLNYIFYVNGTDYMSGIKTALEM
ncbi:phage major tail tube protein [Pectinatus frisingensis]|uniref:phage major tail tube protein n=1 Tax=Pectinatus frisingensis TaxID=865 RepID=UPI0018C49EEA|nr:phage major tail tube protein [Pectinatus frisingensis]